MTTNDIDAIRARAVEASKWDVTPALYLMTEKDIPALCDEVEALRGELARAREVIVAYAHADPSLYGDVCDCDGGDCARAYLRDPEPRP